MLTILLIKYTKNNSPVITVFSFFISIASCGEILIEKIKPFFITKVLLTVLKFASILYQLSVKYISMHMV